MVDFADGYKDIRGFPYGSEVKKSTRIAGDKGSVPWRKAWKPTPGFLLG